MNKEIDMTPSIREIFYKSTGLNPEDIEKFGAIEDYRDKILNAIYELNNHPNKYMIYESPRWGGIECCKIALEKILGELNGTND